MMGYTTGNLMKNFDPFDYAPIVLIVLVVLLLLSAPFYAVGKVITTQQALNAECKTNYNLLQVALAGENLARICQMKNQTIIVK